MKYQFDIVKVEPKILVVTEMVLKQEEISSHITKMFDTVYGWAKQSGLEQAGQNHAIYDPFGLESLRMRVGFPVTQRFQDNDQIRCLEFEAMHAAHTVHEGTYNNLHCAHSSLNQWIDDQSINRTDTSWEVYGGWEEDETKVITEVYVQLKAH